MSPNCDKYPAIEWPSDINFIQSSFSVIDEAHPHAMQISGLQLDIASLSLKIWELLIECEGFGLALYTVCCK